MPALTFVLAGYIIDSNQRIFCSAGGFASVAAVIISADGRTGWCNAAAKEYFSRENFMIDRVRNYLLADLWKIRVSDLSPLPALAVLDWMLPPLKLN